jgi:hypothetical protein
VGCLVAQDQQIGMAPMQKGRGPSQAGAFVSPLVASGSHRSFSLERSRIALRTQSNDRVCNSSHWSFVTVIIMVQVVIAIGLLLTDALPGDRSRMGAPTGG